MSEENVCDEPDPANITELTKSALAGRNYVRKSIQTSTSGLDYYEKLNKLSVTKVENFNVEIDLAIAEAEMMSSLSSLLSKISTSSTHLPAAGGGSSGDEHVADSESSIFNIARVKKVELQDLTGKIPDTSLVDGKCDMVYF